VTTGISEITLDMEQALADYSSPQCARKLTQQLITLILAKIVVLEYGHYGDKISVIKAVMTMLTIRPPTLALARSALTREKLSMTGELHACMFWEGVVD